MTRHAYVTPCRPSAARHTYLPTARQERRAVGERRRQQYVQRVQKDDLSKARRTRRTRVSIRPALHPTSLRGAPERQRPQRQRPSGLGVYWVSALIYLLSK